MPPDPECVTDVHGSVVSTLIRSAACRRRAAGRLFLWGRRQRRTALHGAEAGPGSARVINLGGDSDEPCPSSASRPLLSNELKLPVAGGLLAGYSFGGAGSSVQPGRAEAASGSARVIDLGGDSDDEALSQQPLAKRLKRSGSEERAQHQARCCICSLQFRQPCLTCPSMAGRGMHTMHTLVAATAMKRPCPSSPWASASSAAALRSACSIR